MGHRLFKQYLFNALNFTMHTFKLFFAILLLLTGISATAQTKMVDHFTKVIVSPYIQVTFVEGDEESVTINQIKVDKNRPKYEKNHSNEHEGSHPLYQNTTVVATVTYRTLTDLSLRGEETQLCKSALDAVKFTLKIYGESEVIFNELNAQELETTIYGEASLNLKAGSIKEQKYTCYGEGHINSLSIAGSSSRIIAFGEADLRINVSDRIRITAFGDAKLHYKGNPEIVKGIHFGDMIIDK